MKQVKVHKLGGVGLSQERILHLVVVMAVLAIIARVLNQSVFPLDDAYITLHNARALLSGGSDPSFQGSSALTGATSAVHLILIAGFGSAVRLEAASIIVSILGIVLYAFGMGKVLQKIGCSNTHRSVLLFSAICLGYQPYHLTNGLETGLALAAMVWAFILADTRWLPVICGVMPFIRPELALLSIPLMARRLWQERQIPARQFQTVSLALLSAAPWLLLYYYQTGNFLPSTGSAKVNFFAEANLPLTRRIAIAGTLIAASLIGPFFIGMIGLTKTGLGRCGLFFVVLWVAVSIIVFPGGLFHNWFRYCALFVPPLVIGCAILLSGMKKGQNAVLAILAIWAAMTSIIGIYKVRDQVQPDVRERLVQGVDRFVPPSALIMVHDAGYLPWIRPDRRFIDLVGLKTPNNFSWATALRARPDDRISNLIRTADTYRPEYFVVLAHEPFWGALDDGLRNADWTLDMVSDGGMAGYSIYRLTPPASSQAQHSAPSDRLQQVGSVPQKGARP